jgi:hypothetical protein
MAPPPAPIEYAQEKVRLGKTMSPARRSKFLITGSLIGLLGFLLPGMYSVQYEPAGPGFPQNVPGVTGWFNGFDGPFDGHLVLASIIFTFALGIIARFIRHDDGGERFKNTYDKLSKLTTNPGHAIRQLPFWHLAYHGSAVIVNAWLLGDFFWQFRSGNIPASIQSAFIRHMGGASAVTATRYLYTTIGPTAILPLCGLLIAMIGIYPKTFGILDGLIVTLLLVTWLATNIGLNLPWAHGWQTVPTANGQRPTLEATCTLGPGHSSNCESGNPTATLLLPTPAASTAGCTYDIIIDWDDGTPKATAHVHGSSSAILYSADHTFSKPGSYAVTTTEKVTSGHCPVSPRSSTSQFTLGLK